MCPLNNVHLQNQAERPSRLRIMKRRIPVNDDSLGWPWDRDGSSHPTKILSHPGPGIEPARDRELPSHRDLVPSHPMKKNLVPSWSCGMSGWDQDGTGHPVPCQEMLLFYNIYTNIRSIQSMNISLESAH